MNDSRHHFAHARLVKEWRTAAYWAACQLGGPSARRHPPAVVQAYLPVKGKRRRDPANWTTTVKACVDGFVTAGVFKDDSEEWVYIRQPILSLTMKDVTFVLTPMKGTT